MIELRGVSKTVESGGRPLTILHPLDVAIPSGRFLAVVGPSGSGKSTLLGLLAGLDAPSTGEILIDGIDITKLSEDALARLRGEKIGFVFQFFNLLPTLSAMENVALPLVLDGRSKNESELRARELLDKVGLAERRSHLPEELSGGEIQRVAMARALRAQGLSAPEVQHAELQQGLLIIEDLGGGAGERREPGFLREREVVAQRHAEPARAFGDFERGEAVHVDGGSRFLHRTCDRQVVLAVEARVDSALQAHLGRAALDRFDHAPLDLLEVEEVRVAAEVE